MNYSIEFAQKLSHAYANICRPLCHELNLPQTAFDILMFLANNPQYKTARDIVEVRKIKANLVSVNVDKLVKEGYLERESQKDDRRKIHLQCTEKATPIIGKGRELQETFFEVLLENVSTEQRENFLKTIEVIEENLDLMKNKKEEGN